VTRDETEGVRYLYEGDDPDGERREVEEIVTREE